MVLKPCRSWETYRTYQLVSRISQPSTVWRIIYPSFIVVCFFFSKKKGAFYATTGDDKHCFLYQQHDSSIISSIISASIQRKANEKKAPSATALQIQLAEFSWRCSPNFFCIGKSIWTEPKLPPLGDHHDCHRSVGCRGFLHSWTLWWWPEGGAQTTRGNEGQSTELFGPFIRGMMVGHEKR